MPFTAAEIAGHLQGQVVGDPATVLKNFAPADRAQAGDLTFAENEGFFTRAEQSTASAIIVDGNSVSASKVLIRVANARVAFAKALALFFPEPVLPAGVHPTAVLAPTAQVDATAHVGPHCVIGERVRIGARVVLRAGDFIGPDCCLSEDVVLFPHVTLYARTELGRGVRIHAGSVIGSDGFGYVPDAGTHRKVPQIGNVIIGDDVEIGANVTILPGVTIGDGAMVGAGSVVHRDILPGERVSSQPLRRHEM